ncbi:MAG: 4-hydroxythreonine-4-phosphate dehydrogenase PdxA, partial [Bacteroidetes bacterium HGW-Bacteroidetes-15]
FEIAGEGVASENSFRKALYLAVDLFKNNISYKELTKDPLVVTSHE